jgi:16S rRNA (adenine1518-N6/adenine1519-N6)-dimethyltransferase
MKKKFGQNFLNNQAIIDQIITSSNITRDSLVYEVGPGDGALSRKIVKINPKKYLAVEIDKELIQKLERVFVKKEHSIVNEDALQFDETSVFSKNVTIISNLPYNISLKLLLKWIYQYTTNPWFNQMILMFQKEVGERILSKENSKKYGRISLIVSAFFQSSKVLEINKKNFFPVPGVDSVMIKFTPLKKTIINNKNIHKLEFLSKNLFANRRKKLKNKIKQLFDDKTIETNKLDQYFDLRAENINKENFYRLVKLLED